MSGAFGCEMDLGRCTQEEKEIIRQQVETYKARYELLHGGDYYRLTSPFQDCAYTAWEQVSPDKREALVSRWRIKNSCGVQPITSLNLRLK